MKNEKEKDSGRRTPYSLRRHERGFEDEKAETIEEDGKTKTYYSDGSSVWHGVMGDIETDEFGETC
jgi:hypothetical protein